VAQYRFHGRFISESKARQLANLRNSEKYLTTRKDGKSYSGYKSQAILDLAQRRAEAFLAKSRAIEMARRAEVSRRGWETRRERDRQAKAEAVRRSKSRAARKVWKAKKDKVTARSEAARRGWEARRQRETPWPMADIGPRVSKRPVPSAPAFPDREPIHPGREYFEDDEEIYEGGGGRYREDFEYEPAGPGDFPGEFSGYEYDEADLTEFEDYFMDLATADIDDEDKYEQA
jgi:hypothetical protein